MSWVPLYNMVKNNAGDGKMTRHGHDPELMKKNTSWGKYRSGGTFRGAGKMRREQNNMAR